jgi:hypothetical protein
MKNKNKKTAKARNQKYIKCWNFKIGKKIFIIRLRGFT